MKNRISADRHKRPRKVLLISGCPTKFTPVLTAYSQYTKQRGCAVKVIEYANRQRWSFIAAALKEAYQNKYESIICVSLQALPILFVLSWFSSRKLIYWKLETYGPFESRSLALKLQLFEWLIYRRRIYLIVPSRQRLEFQRPLFAKTAIIPNAPLAPYVAAPHVRSSPTNEMRLVIYGNMRESNRFFLDEWIAATESSKQLHISVIGRNGIDTEKVTFLGTLPHGALIAALCDQQRFHFSIVGYREADANTRLAAPNKLIESLACGLPVIGHQTNPYVAEIVEKYECGILLDFQRINGEMISPGTYNYARLVKKAILAAEDMCLSRVVPKAPFLLN